MKEIVDVIISATDAHRHRTESLERDFDRELDRNIRELQAVTVRRSETFSTPTEHLENIRTKLKSGYNQLMQVGEMGS